MTDMRDARFTVGIDLAKATFVAFVVDQDGVPVGTRARTFARTKAGFRNFLQWIPEPEQSRVVIEPTGIYGKAFIKAVGPSVHGLYEVNARILKRMATTMVQTKTDQADARGIATAGHHLALSNVLDRYRVSFDEAREALALLLSEHDRLRRRIAELKVQISSLAHSPAPMVETVGVSRREELAFLTAQQKGFRKTIEAYARANADKEYRLLRSIPGIGTLTAAALLVKIRDIDRFASADALKGYLGIYPSRRQSGNGERRSSMARHGCQLVRHMLWNAAKCAARWNPICRDYYEQLIERGKAAPAAYGAVCRKLIQIVYGVLKSKHPFDPALAHPNQAQQLACPLPSPSGGPRQHEPLHSHARTATA